MGGGRQLTTKQMKNLDKKTIIIGASGLALMLLFAILYFHSQSKMQEMVEVFSEEKTELINEYQDLSFDYDSLRSNNDDLNQRIELERERIAQLKEELQTVKATNARRIKELQKELSSVRTIMRSFVRQVDSLNQINGKLVAENAGMRRQVDQIRQSNNELTKKNEALNEKVEIAARLEASGVSAIGLNHKEKKVTAADKVTKIKVQFTLLKNLTAEVGIRTVYLRISRPDGQLLMHSASDTFRFEDSDINFSAQRQIEYGGEDTEAYVVYTVDPGELMAGNYAVELFCGGDRIGQGAFSLK